MPAYRERVYICPDQDGQPIWIGDFPLWWDRAAFFTKYAVRRIEIESLSYIDYAFLLSKWEAYAWDEQARKAFSQDPRSQNPYIMKLMDEWIKLFVTAKWIIVESYEWESGLD